jgi:RNA methyltransferase, TrmH family
MAKKLIINSLQNSFIKHLLKLKSNKKYRHLQKQLLIIGNNQISDLAKNKIPITSLILTNNKIDEFREVGCENIYIVTDEILKKITNQASANEVAAVVDMPKTADIKKINPKKIIILDEIKDPGNIGTILRSAYGFSYEAAIITKNSCDPFNDKAISSAKGASVLLPIAFLDEEEILELKDNFEFYLADITGENFEEVKYIFPLALILSNESKGPSLWAKEISKAITIPTRRKGFDSLNVAIAGSILMQKI